MKTLCVIPVLLALCAGASADTFDGLLLSADETPLGCELAAEASLPLSADARSNPLVTRDAAETSLLGGFVLETDSAVPVRAAYLAVYGDEPTHRTIVWAIDVDDVAGALPFFEKARARYQSFPLRYYWKSDNLLVVAVTDDTEDTKCLEAIKTHLPPD